MRKAPMRHHTSLRIFAGVAFVFLLFITSSCRKAAGLDEIVGNWEVSITYKYPEGISDDTMDLGLWNYTFLANGHGSFAGKVYNTDKKEFTYRYDDAKNFIVLKSEGSTSELYVDSISRDSFVLQGTGTSQQGNAIYTIAITFRGRRI